MEKDKKEKLKEEIDNLFDGDSTNSHNVIDRVEEEMLGKNTSDKIDELLKKSK